MLHFKFSMAYCFVFSGLNVGEYIVVCTITTKVVFEVSLIKRLLNEKLLGKGITY